MKRLLAVLLIFCLIPVVSFADLRDLQEALFGSYLDIYGLSPDYSLIRQDALTIITAKDYFVTLNYDSENNVTSALLAYNKKLDYNFIGYGTCLINSFFGKDYLLPYLNALSTFHGDELKLATTDDLTGLVAISIDESGRPCVYVKSGTVIE